MLITIGCKQCGAAIEGRKKYCSDACRVKFHNETRPASEVWRNNLWCKYKITPEEWNAQFEKQGRGCGVCGRKEPVGRGWATDHDHATGKFRGILCMFCNSALGQMFESVELITKLIEYLKQSC